MMRSVEDTVRSLKLSERSSDKKGYGGDATMDSVYRHILSLLDKQCYLLGCIATDIKLLKARSSKRKPSRYNLFIGKMIKQGYSFNEAVGLWNKGKKEQMRLGSQ